jgi:hypothetical protein
VEYFCVVVAAGRLDGSGVAAKPQIGVRGTLISDYSQRFELVWELFVADAANDCHEAVIVIMVGVLLSLPISTDLAEDGPRIGFFVEHEPHILWGELLITILVALASLVVVLLLPVALALVAGPVAAAPRIALRRPWHGADPVLLVDEDVSLPC